MNATNHFRECMRNYLNNRAKNDALFMQKCRNPKKSLDECIQFIFSEVQKSGCNGFADEEIYSMAVHYFDEEDITIDKIGNCHVVVNHTVELTDEEKAEAKERAMKQAQQEAYKKLMEKKQSTKKVESTQPSLF